MFLCPVCSSLYANDDSLCPIDGATVEEVTDPLIGRTVGGRYRLIHRLGAGGMSCVYLARHVLIDRLVAVKTLRARLAVDPEQRDRFMREARAVNRINHKNIVEISDYGETSDGIAYLVMEFVPGEPLFRLLQAGPLPLDRALHITVQIARALARAHEMGVIHRDLKPENILIVRRRNLADEVKVLDFGIAKILDAPSLTGSQQIFGTPGYIAPEYIKSHNIDGRSDLYSLGVVLYEMVTGELPFDYQFPGDLLVKHVTEDPIPPSARCPVPACMEEFILRALAKDPNARFRDAHHFLAGARAVRDELGLQGLVEPSDSPENTVLDLIPPAFLKSIPPAPAHESDNPAHGFMGVTQWRSRFHAIHEALADLPDPPDPLRARLRAANEALEDFEESAALTLHRQTEIENVIAEGRDMRMTLGRAIDQASETASTLRGKYEELASTRDIKRESRARSGDAATSDVLLWEIAACDATLERFAKQRKTQVRTLTDLRNELARRNIDLQSRLDVLVAATEQDVDALAKLERSIRPALDEAERYVKALLGSEHFSSHPTPPFSVR